MHQTKAIAHESFRHLVLAVSVESRVVESEYDSQDY
jgi:hypothetical protein